MQDLLLVLSVKKEEKIIPLKLLFSLSQRMNLVQA